MKKVKNIIGFVIAILAIYFLVIPSVYKNVDSYYKWCKYSVNKEGSALVWRHSKEKIKDDFLVNYNEDFLFTANSIFFGLEDDLDPRIDSLNQSGLVGVFSNNDTLFLVNYLWPSLTEQFEISLRMKLPEEVKINYLSDTLKHYLSDINYAKSSNQICLFSAIHQFFDILVITNLKDSKEIIDLSNYNYYGI